MRWIESLRSDIDRLLCLFQNIFVFFFVFTQMSWSLKLFYTQFQFIMDRFLFSPIELTSEGWCHLKPCQDSVTISPLVVLSSWKISDQPSQWSTSTAEWCPSCMGDGREIHHMWKTQTSISNCVDLSVGDQPQNCLSINNQSLAEISRFHHLWDWQVSNKASHSFPQGKIIGRRRPLSWRPAIWQQVSLHSISQQLHPDPWPWHWPLMALSEVHSDLLRWPALLVSIREGLSGVSGHPCSQQDA